MKQQEPLSASVVLGVAAHPDDLDSVAGGTIAKLTQQGAKVHYLILTDGSKGTSHPNANTLQLTSTRHAEQQTAARKLGVQEVTFCEYTDGELENTNEVRCEIVRHIRMLKPDMVIVMDPSMLYTADLGIINHPDHRAAGQATLDAVYPQARNPLSFPELLEEGLKPHSVKTLLLSNFNDHNYCVDITDTLDQKRAALEAHTSQIKSLSHISPMLEKMAEETGRAIGCDKAESFIRIDVMP